MYRSWDSIIRPLLDALAPQVIVEIGAAEGRNTVRLVEHCRESGARFHIIDPAPDFDVDALAAEHEDIVFHRARSLEVLGGLEPADLALLDGDHNWYTVHHELRALADCAGSAGRPLPVVVLHDVDWPYGRRDMYYDVETIPPEHRQPHALGGVLPGVVDLVPDGLNAHLETALVEGGPRNGVRTAVEDFLALFDDEVRTVHVPGAHGLLILVASQLIEAHPQLERFLAELAAESPLKAHLRAMEEVRLENVLQGLERRRQVIRLRAKLERVAAQRDELRRKLDGMRAERRAQRQSTGTGG